MARREPWAKAALLAAAGLLGTAILKVAFDLSWFSALVAAAGFAAFAAVWGRIEWWALHEAFGVPHDPSAVDRRALERFARSEAGAHDRDASPDHPAAPVEPASPPRKDLS